MLWSWSPAGGGHFGRRARLVAGRPCAAVTCGHSLPAAENADSDRGGGGGEGSPKIRSWSLKIAAQYGSRAGSVYTPVAYMTGGYVRTAGTPRRLPAVLAARQRQYDRLDCLSLVIARHFDVSNAFNQGKR